MDPLSLAILGGSSILGSVLGKTSPKKVSMQEPYAGYNQGTQDLMNLAKSKMNQPGTPYAGSFSINTPDVQSATESTILGKLRNPATPEAYSSDISKNL